MTVGGGMGKPAYMPPEQWVDAHDVDERGDIFAFGVCMYEMFCGRRPYQIAVGLRQEPPEPREVRGDNSLPDRLCALLKRCVDWDREQRPRSMREVRKELCQIHEELFHKPSAWAELPDVSLEADGWNNQGVTYLELGQTEEALRCFERAVAANPTHLEATYNQALLQWRRGEIDDLEVLRRLEKLTGVPGIDAKELALAKAEVHQERFDPEAARAELVPYPDLYEERFAGKEPSRIGLLRTLEGHSDHITPVALTQDGRRALSGSRDATLKLWDLETGQCLRSMAVASPVRSVALTPDALWALAGHEDGTMTHWRLIWSLEFPERDSSPRSLFDKLRTGSECGRRAAGSERQSAEKA